MSTPTPPDARARYWQEQIEAWQQSGQTQQAFCKAHDLNVARFGYWLRKHRQAATPDQPNQPRGFVPVTMSAPAPCNGLSVRLPNGLEVRGIDADNLPLAAQLLSRLS